jgi:hypothetical protein
MKNWRLALAGDLKNDAPRDAANELVSAIEAIGGRDKANSKLARMLTYFLEGQFGELHGDSRHNGRDLFRNVPNQHGKRLFAGIPVLTE